MLVYFLKTLKPLFLKILSWNLEFFFKSSLSIVHRMAENSQNFARIKLIFDSVYYINHHNSGTFSELPDSTARNFEAN